MSKTANVVDGEASESESEIEIAETPVSHAYNLIFKFCLYLV